MYCYSEHRPRHKRDARKEWLSYVTRFYFGSPRAAISVTARSASCHCRLIYQNLGWWHDEAKWSVMDVILPTQINLRNYFYPFFCVQTSMKYERSSWTNVLLHYHKHLSHEILVQLYHKQNSIMFATNLVASWGNYDVIWGIFYVRLRRALHTKRQQPYVTCHWDPKWLLVHEYTNIIISSNKKIKRASIIPQHHLGDDVSTQWREAGLLNHSNWIMFVYNNKPCSSKVEQATLLYHLL
jgi:hypothetical protein